jgi:hypothetical protein
LHVPIVDRSRKDSQNFSTILGTFPSKMRVRFLELTL